MVIRDFRKKKGLIRVIYFLFLGVQRVGIRFMVFGFLFFFNLEFTAQTEGICCFAFAMPVCDLGFGFPLRLSIMVTI